MAFKVFRTRAQGRRGFRVYRTFRAFKGLRVGESRSGAGTTNCRDRPATSSRRDDFMSCRLTDGFCFLVKLGFRGLGFRLPCCQALGCG